MSKSFTRTTRLAAGNYTLKDILILGYGYDDKKATETLSEQRMSINEEVPTEKNVALFPGDKITVQVDWAFYNVEVI